MQQTAHVQGLRHKDQPTSIPRCGHGLRDEGPGVMGTGVQLDTSVLPSERWSGRSQPQPFTSQNSLFKDKVSLWLRQVPSITPSPECWDHRCVLLHPASQNNQP